MFKFHHPMMFPLHMALYLKSSVCPLAGRC